MFFSRATKLDPLIQIESYLYTNIPENKIFTNCISYDISDHVPTITIVKSYSIKSPIKRSLIRDTRKLNPESFLSDLEIKLSTLTFNSMDANNIWNNFENLFNSVLNEH